MLNLLWLRIQDSHRVFQRKVVSAHEFMGKKTILVRKTYTKQGDMNTSTRYTELTDVLVDGINTHRKTQIAFASIEMT